MERSFRRNWERLGLKRNLEAKLTVDYMGERLDAKLIDINSDGVGFIIDKEPNSIIDYHIAMLHFQTEDQYFSHPARILYSQKIGSSGRKRRYGAYFFANKQKEMKSFIRNSCEPLKREGRADLLFD
jgi:hypothetical protein